MDAVPFGPLTVELRGVKPASEFTSRESGQLVNVPAKAQFEFERPNGEIGHMDLSSRQFEKATGDFEFHKAAKGHLVVIEGEVRSGETGPYLVLHSAKKHAALRSAA